MLPIAPEAVALFHGRLFRFDPSIDVLQRAAWRAGAASARRATIDPGRGTAVT